ncbi:MAG: hypothetical protein CTY34_11445 [Methylobacter sp.]|nr:MAG: hypothetical protein CTY34_11445 [Methylobacter sp.]PPD05064.1 MAG: hypothetical protein CTY29_02805 [Methylobacter sp.]PPD22306.1 MAG: hypothetical protein CTY24_06695 [Methylobacter sp.]PPD36111.1 MAG: hypothetical protein CTY18_05490 [Methylomonas sp.]
MKTYRSLKMFAGFLALVLVLAFGRVMLQTYWLKSQNDMLSGLLDGRPIGNSSLSANQEPDDAGVQTPTAPPDREESFLIKRRSETAVAAARDEVKDFKKSYQKPEKCYDMRSDEVRIWCANHFMRARKAFEQQKAGS